MPADLAAAIPGGGLNPSGTCSPCPGGEDHLKRRRRLRRIVPSPPVPLSPWLPALIIERWFYLFCTETQAPLCIGHLLGRDYKCRRRLNAGVPGAEPPAK